MSQIVEALEERTTCANCGASLSAKYCEQCGQHRRESRRLEVRQIVARFVEHLYDFDSAFLRTFLGLTTRPGSVCREYVQGRRKRYMNPFGYFVLAVTVALLIDSAVTKLLPARAVAAKDEPEFEPSLLLLLLIPLAIIWSKLFRRAGYNLAENYVFALYIFGHFTWVELLVLQPASLILNHLGLGLAYGVIGLGYLGVASAVFYGERPLSVIWKLTVSILLMAIVIMLFGAIEVWLGVIPMEPGK